MLPDDLLKQIDQVAREEGVNRSKLLRTAVLAYFSEREDHKQKEKRRDDIRRAKEIQDQLRRETAPWDSLAALQRERQST